VVSLRPRVDGKEDVLSSITTPCASLPRILRSQPHNNRISQEKQHKCSTESPSRRAPAPERRSSERWNFFRPPGICHIVVMACLRGCRRRATQPVAVTNAHAYSSAERSRAAAIRRPRTVAGAGIRACVL